MGTPFLKMLVIRCLRPDRMTTAMMSFCENTLPNGEKYSKCDQTLNSNQVIAESLLTSSTVTPIFFILSPGVDVVSEVDKLAIVYELERGTSYHNVSMGQALMPKWCIALEKTLDEYALEGS